MGVSRSISGLLWGDFEIEGRSAAFASHGTYEKWCSEQPEGLNVDDYSAAAVWNEALRLGYLLGSGATTLAELGLSAKVES